MVTKETHHQKLDIPVQLDNGNTIVICIISESGEKIVEVDEAEAREYGEAPIQLYEASTYEYKVEDKYQIDNTGRIIRQSKFNPSSGRLVPNIYVGTLKLNICDSNGSQCGCLELEVRSIKTNYRTDYRRMLEYITEWSTELLMQHSSPVSQQFTIDYSADAATLYQRFAFIKSILESDEFDQAVYKIIKTPSSEWEKTNKKRDIRSIRRPTRSIINQISSSEKRIRLPDSHPQKRKLGSVPEKVLTSSKKETIDTAENRFIKHALKSFLKICSDFKEAAPETHRLKMEAENIELNIEQYLNHDFFAEISSPDILPLNSPTLQRKGGYREILRVWLMFDLAAQLTWQGGNDVYEGRKKDVASLYEYWVFFKLLNTIEKVFDIKTKPAEKLIEATGSNLDLKLKQGKYFPIKGICNTYSRKLNIQFSFNKTFTGDQDYPNSGSWTSNMRPDYTLSIWPHGINESQAEAEELIVHIHFDAKYKVKDLDDLFSANIQNSKKKNQELDKVNQEEKEGKYKRADLLKMHAYRDAIRRTGGAYVLYPGDKNLNKKGFHEIIPGLGAFPLRPLKSDDSSQHLKDFLKDVLSHFLNRASQREEISFHKYDTYKEQPGDSLEEKIPENFGQKRSLIPDKTNVLVAFYKGKGHLDWIKKHGLYNARTGNNRGALKIGTKEAGAKFLLLHTFGETVTDKLLKIKESPIILSKQKLVDLNYPNPSQDYYLVFKVTQVNRNTFREVEWDITQLSKYSSGRGSALPFSVSLTELMKAKATD
ncbi:DUF2357 domain-containing protein [Fodinibius salsisoli]|uniref:DUF2357 domain-containing protein n=1 Tax=Fodinibius salsisoli TaxID=2820877 RepID=A0ABT3PS96_9BACT|nr:DUF2357 domain-containing protein [Fodinibius salsisoli]MCW9708728.1 DUF2357 domain-containing protein [Fodinibius salsisoli]